MGLSEEQSQTQIQENNTNIPNQNIPHKLLSEGAYGCVFKPGYTCQGNIENKKYITKIQEYGKSSENEWEISTIIKTIKNYDLFFAPIISSCPISFEKLKNQQDCGVIEKRIQTQSNKNTTFQSNKIRYILGKTLGETVEDKINEYNYRQQTQNQIQNTRRQKHPFYFVLEMHNYLLKSFSKMKIKKLIHYDLKQNNVLFDIQNNVPILIDFGMSINTTKINPQNPDLTILRKTFFNDSEYIGWTLDTMFLSYLSITLSNQTEEMKSHWASQPIDTTPYQEKIKIFLEKSPLFNENQRLLLSNLFPKTSSIQETIKNFRTNTQTKWEEYLQTTLKPKTQLDLFQTLWKNCFTWDTYALSTMFLLLVSKMPKPNDPKTITEMENYVKINIENIQNLPHTRKTPLQMFKELATK